LSTLFFLAVAVVFVLLQIPLSRVFLQAGGPGTLYLQGLSALSVQAHLYAYNILSQTHHPERLRFRPFAILRALVLRTLLCPNNNRQKCSVEL
jgi:hypothetical protein